MPLETYAGWRIMRKHDVHAADVRKPFDLVRRVVPFSVTLQSVRKAQVIRRTIASADTAHANVTRMLILNIDRARHIDGGYTAQ
jgi:hypothetical protein